MPNLFKQVHILFTIWLVLSLSGCSLFLQKHSALARISDPEVSFTPLSTQEVYYFISKEAFPPELQYLPVAELLTPYPSQWTYRDLVQEFQKKAAEVGANAVVFDRVNKTKLDFGYWAYEGHATAYRLYRQTPKEDVDLSASQFGTQDPDLSKVK